VAVDQAGKNGEARCVDRLGIARCLGLGTTAGVRHMAVVDDDHRLARGLASGRIEKGIRVYSANHEAILVVDKGLAESTGSVQPSLSRKSLTRWWILTPGPVGPIYTHFCHSPVAASLPDYPPMIEGVAIKGRLQPAPCSSSLSLIRWGFTHPSRGAAACDTQGCLTQFLRHRSTSPCIQPS